MKKVCCFVLCALLVLFAASAMADCATDGHDYSEWNPVFLDGGHCANGCAVCGEPDPSNYQPHYVMCTTGTECVYCGTPVADLTSFEKWCNGGERLYNETHCWEVCESCGDEIYKMEHDAGYCNSSNGLCGHCGQPSENINHRWVHIDQVMGNCVEGTKNTFKCELCGVEKTETDACTGECWFELAYDSTKHWYYCTGCNLVKEEQEHYESCDSATPNTCYLCEQPCEPNHASCAREAISFATCIATGEAQVTCNYCGEQWVEEIAIDPNNHMEVEVIAEVYPNCKEDGSATLRCKACGAEFEDTWVSDGECWYVFVNKGDTHAFMCEGCGTVETEEAHYVSCIGGTTCTHCGATGVTGDVAHNVPGDVQTDANSHWWDCVDCGEKVWAGEHHAFCDMDTTTCMSCGTSGVNIVIYHGISEDDLVTTATEHWWVCPVCEADTYRGAHEDLDGTGICYCGQPVPSEEHACEWVTETVTAATCTEPGLEQTVCSICGEVSEEKQLYPTGHSWTVTKTVDATCEKEGRINYACANCDATSLKKLPATGHTLVDGVCACGYAEEVVAEEPAVEEPAVEEPAVAEVVLENVTVEAAEGEALSSDVALIVSEPEEDVDVTTLVPEAIRETVAQVYFVRLTEKGETIDPTGSLKIAIELEEGADLTGKKLMLVQEDGTLLEITYEVVEGKMVFVTDAIGTFVLVDAPAE